MILLDTNVVSEFMRPQPSPSVVQWASRYAVGDLQISVITIHEIELGLARMPSGVRRESLERIWNQLLASFKNWILPLDEAAAHATADALAHSAAAGRVMGTADAQIAGVALSHHLILATRNTKDFLSVPRLELVDPFTAERA